MKIEFVDATSNNLRVEPDREFFDEQRAALATYMQHPDPALLNRELGAALARHDARLIEALLASDSEREAPDGP